MKDKIESEILRFSISNNMIYNTLLDIQSSLLVVESKIKKLEEFMICKILPAILAVLIYCIIINTVYIFK